MSENKLASFGVRAAKLIGLLFLVTIGLMVIEVMVYGPDSNPKNPTKTSIIHQLTSE